MRPLLLFMMSSASFIESLAAVPTMDRVYNPYAGASAAADRCRTNLECYLRQMNAFRPAVLLVGEAPGYRGCRLTGIPFTSEHIMAGHPQFAAAQGFQIDGRQREASATAVWRTLDELAQAPLLWNAFPFHPHRAELPDSNRTPTGSEIACGEPYLRNLLTHYPIQLIVAVGKKAGQALAYLGHCLGVSAPSGPWRRRAV